MMGNVIFMYNYYKDSDEKALIFHIMKTYVVTTGTVYEKDETKDLPNLADRDLKNESIKWFKEISGDDYRHIDKLEYWFVKIEIPNNFNADAITCPERGEWKILPIS